MRAYAIGISFVVLSVLVSGCSTNSLGDPKRKQKISKLSAEGESLLDEITTVKSEKEKALALMKQRLLNLQDEIRRQYGEKNMYMTKVKDGIQVTLLDNVLFASGRAQINRGGVSILKEVSQIIKDTEKSIQITGHTDNEPINQTKNLYRSNWELSMHRALSVLHFFEEDGVSPEKMFVVGYGEFKPVASNASKEGRAQNRRVDIILLDDVPRSEVAPGKVVSSEQTGPLTK